MTQQTEYAFPMGSDWGNENGMTLRDYFAGQALSGNMRSAQPFERMAKDAYEMADAMMDTRK